MQVRPLSAAGFWLVGAPLRRWSSLVDPMRHDARARTAADFVRLCTTVRRNPGARGPPRHSPGRRRQPSRAPRRVISVREARLKTRDPLRLERRRFETVQLRDAVPEMFVLNSHDGTSA